MKYEEYSYLWPPRPEVAAPVEMLGFYERRGWTAQVKKNGTCTVIFARGDEVIFKTRHDDDHKAWVPMREHHAMFAGSSAWNVYVAELLHSKGPTIKNHLHLFDVLVHNGESLVGKRLGERLAILGQVFPRGNCPHAGFGSVPVKPMLSRAETFSRDFKGAWAELGPLDEGLVLKDARAELLPCIAEKSNGAWQAKVRRPHANYSF